MVDGQSLELSIQSTSESATHILDLNFDCLHVIFSLECFSMLDLCSIRESYSCFKEVVDDVFAKRFKNYEVDLRETAVLETTTTILKSFGPFISELWIVGNYNENLTSLLDLLTEYCSSTLKSIRLSYSKITKAQSIKLQQIFDKLQKISLSYCTVYSRTTLLSKCESLVALKLEAVKFDVQHLVLENTFPKLDRLEYCSCSSSTDFLDDFNKSNDFFSRHQNLKSLRLHRYNVVSHLLPVIFDNCKQLAELDITFDEDEDEVKLEKALTSILTLDHLYKLGIYCGRNITKFIKKLRNLKSLEILILFLVEGDSELVLNLSKITRLQELELRHCEGLADLNPLADLEGLTNLRIILDEDLPFDLVRFIKRIINLKTLYLDVLSFEMDKKMYLSIVDVVRQRPGRFQDQDALQISCHTANDGSANSFDDGDSRKFVRIFEI